MAPYAVEARDVYQGPVIVDFPDALSLYYERAVRHPRQWAKAWIDRHEAQRLPAAEQKLLSAGFHNLVCSEVDKARLATVDPSATVSVIPHTIDLDEFSPRARNDGSMRGAFTGTLYYLPNVDGLLWLQQSVLPFVGDDRFEIDVSGYGATSELDPVKEDPRFHFKGYVEKMADHLWTDDIYLCPIRVAAGVRFKLLEAFAAGMATVSTTLGFEGMDCTPGEHLLVADSPEEFARAIRYLLDHPGERARLGRNARAFMAERYSEEAFARNVEGLLASS
jgi:glycosyltransferase involved in cell wall biosynthesis